MEIMDALTEEAAAESFARAWNRLDVEPLEILLNEETIYESQMVLTAMVGRDQILQYLEGKFQTLRKNPRYTPYFEIGYYGYQPCIVMCQGSKDNPVGLALFKVGETHIKRIDLCIVPTPQEAVRTGRYPG